mgnify:CR=1 FL=1
MKVDYRLAFDLAPVGLVMSRSRQMVDCNQEVLAIFGATREQLLGQSFEILYPTADEFQRTGARRRVRHAGQHRQQRHVVGDVEERNQVRRLEHEADVAGAEVAETGIVDRGQILTIERDAAAARRIESAEQVQQRRLAAARRAAEEHALAAPDHEIDAAQRIDAQPAPAPAPKAVYEISRPNW